jgi:hypothetical protein
MKELDALYQALSDITGRSPDNIREDMTLYPDLGLAGADGWELVDRLNETYSIDWADFDPYAFFGPEVGFNPLSFLKSVFSGRHAVDMELARKVTVGHLKAVCLQGKWFYP